jgi:hypothetical protein
MHSLNGRRRSIWVADFETTTDPDDCRVWGWGIADIEMPDDVAVGTDIASFIRRVADSDKTIYFHNLKFDGAFIIDYLFRSGYAHTSERNVRRGRFSTLISSMGMFYSIKVHWKNGRETEFRDSLKKLPMSVANVAHAFNQTESKGEIDYETFRPVGHDLTAEEADYIRRDVAIIANAIRVQTDEGMSRLTVGADSLAQFKTMTGKKKFDRLFPVLSADVDAQIRRAYRGGFTYADPRAKGKIVGPGRVFDVNSLYPSVMFDRALPHGVPEPFIGEPGHVPGHPLSIIHLTFTAKLKPNHIPCIQIKGSSRFTETEYQTDIKEPVTISCTNIDLALWEEHYDLHVVEFHGGWAFKAATGIFSEYITKWMQVKETTHGGLRVIAKLFLNSLYGKFATNPDVTPKVPIMGDDNIVRLVTGPEETREPVYTAMGAFITAYARDVTIRAAQHHYDDFLYADTDSLHLLGTGVPDTLDVHPSRLGAWKHEYDFTSAVFARAKCYTELKANGELETHIAGLPDSIASMVRFEHYRTGHTFHGKLMPVRVPGGIVLQPTSFQLQV